MNEVQIEKNNGMIRIRDGINKLENKFFVIEGQIRRI